MKLDSPRRRGLRSTVSGLGAIAVLLLAAVPSGCGKNEYETGVRTTASGPLPSTSQWRFEISQPRGPMFLPVWLPSLSMVKEESWPYGLAAAYTPPKKPSATPARVTNPSPANGAGSARAPGGTKAAGKPKATSGKEKPAGKAKPAERASASAPPKPPGPAGPTDTTHAPEDPASGWLGRIGITWHSEEFEDSTIAARFAKVAGRQFFLVSAPVPRTKDGPKPSAPDRSIHTMLLLDVDGGLIEQVLVPSVEVDRSAGALEFEAMAFRDRLVVMYADGPAVHQIVGTFVHGDLTFTKPELACRAPESAERAERVGLVRMRAGPDRLHVLWCQGMQLLHASSTGPWESGWSPAQTISLTANGSNCEEGADLVIEGPDVCIAWSDNRLRSKWNEQSGYDNDLKLFVAVSRDGGATFSTPVLFSDPLNKAEQVNRVFLTLANDKVILCWTEEARGSWRTGILDRGGLHLEASTGKQTDKQLHEAFTGRMKTVLGEVPYTPPRLPVARRPSMPIGSD